MTCCCENKALKIYKNYPTEFADVDWLSIIFESQIDLTNFEAQFILGSANREWTDLTDGIVINLTEQETSALPIGLNYGTLIVTDSSGNSKPFSTAIPVEVLTWVEGDQEIDTYNMTVNALLDNETNIVINIEYGKVSLDFVNEKILEHNNSEDSHPYIKSLINNGVLTFKQNGEVVGTFSANQKDNTTIEFGSFVSGVSSVNGKTGIVVLDINDLTNQEQQDSLNSGITSSFVGQITTNKDNISSLQSNKQDKLTEGSGIDITNSTISNSGVISISTGTTNGTISVNTAGTTSNVAVYGLGSAAYTSSTDYLTPSDVTSTYSATGTAPVNGTAVASALSVYQTTSNLVTSVSSASTDTQYPSAKLFYDTCGDIETLINAL